MEVFLTWYQRKLRSKARSFSTSESQDYEKPTNVFVKSLSEQFQALPDRLQPLQNTIYANRKGLIAAAAAALVCTQVPETTKLQLSVFAAGLSSTIMEQSKTLITHKVPKTSNKLKKPEVSDDLDENMPETILFPVKKSSRVIPDQSNCIKKEEGSVSEDRDARPMEYIEDDVFDQQTSKSSVELQRVASAESSHDIIGAPSHATLQEENGITFDHFDSEGRAGHGNIVTSSLRGKMAEKDENVIVVQSNIVVQQGSGNTVIVQNNIVVPEGSKSTIIIQSNIKVPEDSQTVNMDQVNEASTYQIGKRLLVQLGAAIKWGGTGQLWESGVREIANGGVYPSDSLEDEDPVQIVPHANQPAADELNPECYNVFQKFLHKDCRGNPGEAESNPPEDKHWIESLLTDAWVLNMDL